MIAFLLLFLLLFALSAFFSGAEMAFVSSNKIKMREMADSGNPAAHQVTGFYRKPQRFLITLLIGNNISNISITAILAYLFKEYLGLESEWAVTVALVPLLIVFAETIPKDFCRLRANAVLLTCSGYLNFFSDLFRVPASLFLRAVDFFCSSFQPALKMNIFVNEEEFRSVIEESVRSGVVSRYEKKIIDTILDFERIVVSKVMIPLAEAPKVDITEATVGDVKEIARKTHARMVLVYEEEPALVVGMVYVYDLLFESRDSLEMKTFLRSPVFLPGSTTLENAFLTLQARRQSYAVVTDSGGEVIGTVPIDRLLTHSTP
jgi:CBS domain containing-hemolysin-like protein